MNSPELEIQDIYNVWYHPFWQQSWFIVTGIVVCVALISIISYWLYKKQQQETALEPWEVALQHLEAIEDDDFSTSKKFYTTLTSVLKLYFQNRYQTPFVGDTDDEFLMKLEQHDLIASSIFDQIKELLSGVVLIKFAHQAAAQEQMKQALKKAKSIILETRIVPQ